MSESESVRHLGRVCLRIGLAIVCAALTVQTAKAQVGMPDDGISHPPPSAGTYAYNSFVPANTPAAAYVDPVFNTTVTRITTDHKPDDIYGHNGMWNADGTRYLHLQTIINIVTGASECTNLVPIGNASYERSFDPVNPNVLYYQYGAQLRTITIQGGGICSDSLYFTAPSQLLPLGGEVNWMDASGRFMVLRYGPEPSVYVYNMQTTPPTPFGNPVSGAYIDSHSSHIGITPDAKYLVGGGAAAPAYSGQCALGDGWGTDALFSWPIDHVSQAIGGANEFWSLAGAHADYMSSSDGHTYAVAGDYWTPAEWLADVSNNAANLCASRQHALANNRRLLALGWSDARHVSTVAKGPLQDYVFVSSEDPGDTFNSGSDDGTGNITPWHLYRQEIIAVNVVTGQVLRVADHRSRSIGNYDYQPRVSASWCGQYVGWASNFDQNTAPETVDAFAVQFSTASCNGGAPVTTRIEENDPSIVYSGGDWPGIRESPFSAGRAVESEGTGARATVTFTGTGIRWIAYRDEWSGIANIYVDGVAQGAVDTYSTPGQYQALMYIVPGLPEGTHTLAVEVTGTKNPNAMESWIWADAFDITP